MSYQGNTIVARHYYSTPQRAAVTGRPMSIWKLAPCLGSSCPGFGSFTNCFTYTQHSTAAATGPADDRRERSLFSPLWHIRVSRVCSGYGPVYDVVLLWS